MLDRFSHQEECTAQIDGEHLIEVVDRHRRDQPVLHDSAVGYDSINAAERFLGLGKQSLHRLCMADVPLDGCCGTACGLDVRYDAQGSGFTACVVHDHCIAITCETRGNGLADATGCSGHDDRLLCVLTH